MRRFALALAAAGALLTSLAGASTGHATQPQSSLATHGVGRAHVAPLAVSERVEALAQDGKLIAWVAASDCLNAVKTWNVATGARTTLARIRDPWAFDYGGGCEVFSIGANVVPGFPAFAIAGRRALWGAFNANGNDGNGGFLTAASGERQKLLEDITWGNYFWGDYMTGVVGDGPTLAYSTLYVDSGGDLDACANGPCVFRVTRGTVKRVVGDKVQPLRGVTRPMAIAVSGTRVAVVPAGGPYRCAKQCMDWSGPKAKPNGTVEIRDVASGTLVSRFSPKGTVRAIALAPKIAAVLVQQGAARRIERYNAATGSLIGSGTVPRATAPVLGIADSRIVYRVGKAIWLLNAMSGRTQLLHTAAATPVGLSVEGRRVAWAENTSPHRARIHVVMAP